MGDGETSVNVPLDVPVKVPLKDLSDPGSPKHATLTFIASEHGVVSAQIECGSTDR